ncbi:transposase family protein [Streptomyces sp. NPDC059639]|uniref:transposase family protein n=1 Tax=Streptomyces sp. NPDC059639 TaxID=3346891 RepID=UPI0036AEF9D8
MWVETFTGLSTQQFGRLLRTVRDRRGNGTLRGRPWGLPPAETVVAVYHPHEPDHAMAELCQRVTVPATAPASTAGWSVPHRKRSHRALHRGEEDDNAAHRKVRARVEHVIGRMKNYKILRDCRQRGDGLHHAFQAVAQIHNLARTS